MRGLAWFAVGCLQALQVGHLADFLGDGAVDLVELHDPRGQLLELPHALGQGPLDLVRTQEPAAPKRACAYTQQTPCDPSSWQPQQQRQRSVLASKPLSGTHSGTCSLPPPGLHRISCAPSQAIPRRTGPHLPVRALAIGQAVG